VDTKTALLRKELVGDGQFNMQDFGPNGLTCPLDPSWKVYGVIADECSVFKSAVQPMKFSFQARKFEAGISEMPKLETYSIVFKNGDDTRQDSLVNNMVAIMDYLLKQVRYDFKLTPFKVLAASPNDGILEFVPSKTVTAAQEISNGNLYVYLTSLDSDPVRQKEIL
jgi:phosphatidylinositol 3-kinase